MTSQRHEEGEDAMSADAHEQDDQHPIPPPDVESSMTLSAMTLPQIERTIDVEPVSLGHDEMLRRVLLATVLCRRAQEFRRRVEEAAIAWIKVHGPLFSGPVIYVATPEKTVRCINPRLGLDLLLETTGGDLDAASAYLSASPFKYGSCAKLMSPEQWMQVFQEMRRDRLIFKPLDSRFLPKRQPRKQQ
jgi:hypothetical protein